MPFLPITVEEMKEYGWEQPDFVYVIGDAYIDHPSFGPAIISRTLENFGYKVCIISQPDINNNKDFLIITYKSQKLIRIRKKMKNYVIA